MKGGRYKNFDIHFSHMIAFYFSRMEDLTNPEDIRRNTKCDRRVSLYGYLRGAHLKNKCQIHMPGILVVKCTVFVELLGHLISQEN